ncbi:hypothetical protein C8A00DRAFT_39881 [Chaetomidium leptoderma]|uniref:Uncharacterized protein n=1 Tax=Chaetomidium leptoderma TaxID=669021 RepID=A0AAN7A0N5_9PEZI|nr:hypothetical protein C8A00DRAFT_39881 [Chaetomidium leptoderma]
MRELLGTHPGELGTHGRDQTRGARRRSSTYRRTARNVESFNRNRNHRVRRFDDNVAVLYSYHRARTRSMARIQAEHEQEQQQEQQQQQQQMTAPNSDVAVVPNHIDSQPNSHLRNWKPSIVLGSPLWVEGEDPNAIEIADRKVAQTRLWAGHYQGVPDFVRMHQEAVREREELDETAEVNTTPRSALNSVQASAIQQRLDHLRFLLQDSHFPPERANMEAAVAGYESGAIPYSDSYTLIWAGRIVDRCPDFDSFNDGRRARLDRYLAEYGPGWLWYELPLSDGGGTVLAKKGLCLEDKPIWRRGTDNMGHYRIQMGFRRRKEHVARTAAAAAAESPFTTTKQTPPSGHRRRRSTTVHHQHPNTSRPGTTAPDPDGPRIIWDTLLDTGATLPCLYEGDLAKLGISKHTYAAQSCRTIVTADSTLNSRVYELDVSVIFPPREEEEKEDGNDDNDNGPTSSSSPPSSQSPPSPGGADKQDEEKEEKEDPSPSPSCTIPIVVFPGTSTDFTSSEQAPDRLSGILPFHVCYLSGAPGSFKLWMGSDRRDVLGAGKLPGLMRYGGILEGGQERQETMMGRKGKRLAMTTTTTKLARWMSRELKTPERVIFEHAFPDGSGRVLRDEDVGDGNVVMAGPRCDKIAE